MKKPPSGSNIDPPPEPASPPELLEEDEPEELPELLWAEFVDKDEDEPSLDAAQAQGATKAERTKRGRIERMLMGRSYHRSAKCSAGRGR